MPPVSVTRNSAPTPISAGNVQKACYLARMFRLRDIQRRFDRPAVLGQYRFTEPPRVMQFALRYEF